MKQSKGKPAKKPKNLVSELLKALSLIQTAEEAGKFLDDLCTPAEIQALADRWRVVALIKMDKSYREIYAETGVSVTTVGRVARSLMFGEGGYNLIYNRMSKRNERRA